MISCTTTTNTGAADGVSDPALASILIEHWEDALRRDPLNATRLGDHRYDDRVEDRSFAAREEEKKLKEKWLAEARALPAKGMTAADRTTLQLFIETMESELEVDACNFDEWTISVQENPLTLWNELAELHQVKTPADGAHLLARYRAIPAALQTSIDNLKRGAAQGLYTNAESMRRVIAMVKTQLALKTKDWPMLAPAHAAHETWSEAERTAFARDLEAVVESGIRPAFERYLALLETELQPHARGDDRVGLAALPIGKTCYAASIRHHTTLSPAPSAEELHQIGLAEIERINGEMRALGKKLLGTDDLAKILEKLRTDPALYFTTDQEVEEKAKRALAAAKARIPEYFGILPKADCVVTRVPDYEAPFTTIAYYRPPVPDGSKPGEYFINVYEPKTRPRYEAEALAFHESIPGHHLQIAIAQELPAIPAFRKHHGMTAYVEGWGLYSEQLAEEMGLYSDDLDRMGKLSYEAWRASRLVVDTGMHAMGWSRQAAKEFMLAHTALAANNIDNEVDRYIGWPGQALAYKTGQLEISRLRAHAEEALGPRFQVKGFHDAVLGRGPVSLPVLRAQIEEWITSVAP